MKRKIAIVFLIPFLFGFDTPANELPDIRSISTDLNPPAMVDEPPAAGKRVKQTASDYQGTRVYHSLYLPVDWESGKTYPVIVEYAGNGPYKNSYGDSCTGNVEDCNLGYGISGGTGFIWICLPFISEDCTHNQRRWWGDVQATVDYCKTVIPRICHNYGGDSSAVFLMGFSRGSIGCNLIGLHDDTIAAMWRGFVCHSHYDGVRQWDYDRSDRSFAVKRLKRLGNKPQFISHEISVEETRQYLSQVCPQGRFTFLSLPYRNHTDSWVLQDIPERKILRDWVHTVLRSD